MPTQPAKQERQRERTELLQIVQHLPPADRRHSTSRTNPLRARTMTEYPGQELPVPTCPPVITKGGDVVASREFLHNLDIGGETGTGENAFEQIVAEKRRILAPGRRARTSKASTS